MKFLYPLSLLFILLSYSCSKDNDASKSGIYAGENDNLIVVYHDTVLIGQYNKGFTYLIDLNVDDIPDISFGSEIWGSPGSGMHAQAVISTINEDFELLGLFDIDTLFRSKSVSFYTNEGYVSKYITNTYTCKRLLAEDEILKVETVFKLLALDKGQLISDQMEFAKDTLNLFTDSSSLPPNFVGSIGDTSIYESNRYLGDCYYFPQDDIKYIGVKHRDGRLGWIKIVLYDSFKIMILESAFQ